MTHTPAFVQQNRTNFYLLLRNEDMNEIGKEIVENINDSAKVWDICNSIAEKHNCLLDFLHTDENGLTTSMRDFFIRKSVNAYVDQCVKRYKAN